MKHLTVLSDLDGTLADTMPLYVASLIEAFAAVGIEYSEEDFARTFPTGITLEEYLAQRGVDAGLGATIRELRDAAHIRRLEEQASLYPQAEPLVNGEDRIVSAIVTGSQRNFLQAIHRRLPALGDIPTVCREDMGQQQKPDPYGLLLAAEALGVEAKDCVYLGDQPFDVIAAKRAGMEAILVRTAHTPAEYRHTHEAATHDELVAMLSRD